jgi:hypothetical protein
MGLVWATVCDKVVFVYRALIDEAAASFGVEQVKLKVRTGGVSGM